MPNIDTWATIERAARQLLKEADGQRAAAAEISEALARGKALFAEKVEGQFFRHAEWLRPPAATK